MPAPRSRPPDLAAAFEAAWQARGLSRAEVVERARRDRSAVYRVLAGTTADPCLSTFVDLCGILGVNPDAALGVPGAALFAGPGPEVRALLEDVGVLDEADRRLVLHLLRAALGHFRAAR